MATPVTLRTLQTRYEKQEPISVITAYDATFARLVDEAGIDCILVGDSLGNVIQGQFIDANNSPVAAALSVLLHQIRTDLITFGAIKGSA